MLTEHAAPPDNDRWLSRLIAAGRKLETDDMRLAVRQIEALWEHRQAADWTAARPDTFGIAQTYR